MVTEMDKRLTRIAENQFHCLRIRNTPMPAGYVIHLRWVSASVATFPLQKGHWMPSVHVELTAAPSQGVPVHLAASGSVCICGVTWMGDDPNLLGYWI